MRRTFQWGGLLILSIAFVVPTLTDAQEKKADTQEKKTDKKTDDKKTDEPKTKTKEKAKEKVKPDWAWSQVGKIRELSDTDAKGLEFTLQVTLQLTEPNPDGQRQLVDAQKQLLQQQQQYANSKSLQDRQNIAKQIAQSQINITKAQGNLIKVTSKDFDLKFKEREGLRVRADVPQTEYDEGGEIKKADPAKPAGFDGFRGFPREKNMLKVGQIVEVFVYKDSKKPDPSKVKGGIDDKAIEGANFRHEVIMIYVATKLQEPGK